MMRATERFLYYGTCSVLQASVEMYFFCLDPIHWFQVVSLGRLCFLWGDFAGSSLGFLTAVGCQLSVDCRFCHCRVLAIDSCSGDVG